MAVRRPLSSIATGKPGRPKTVEAKARELIGSAGVAILRANDLHIVPGKTLRELALFCHESPHEPPKTDTT